MNEALGLCLMAPGAPDVPLPLEDLLHRPEWHQRAACRGVGADAFVTSRGTPLGRGLKVCDECPVSQVHRTNYRMIGLNKKISVSAILIPTTASFC